MDFSSIISQFDRNMKEVYAMARENKPVSCEIESVVNTFKSKAMAEFMARYAERETETENGMDEQTEAVPEAEVYFDYDIADEDDELSGTQLATEEPKPQTGGAEREIDGYSAWLKSAIDEAA